MPASVEEGARPNVGQRVKREEPAIPTAWTGRDKVTAFEEALMPHLNSAYNLARWLTRNAHDAEDVVQEAYLRAFRSFDGFYGADARRWLLAIVRNTGYTWLRRNRLQEPAIEFDEELHGQSEAAPGPEARLLEEIDAETVRRALEELPAEGREALVLRELEGLSYKEIADVAGVPVGTVMSRLARARERLLQRMNRLNLRRGAGR